MTPFPQPFHATIARKNAGGGAGTGLLDSLLEWWDLDETSGDALSANGGTDLADNNTVGYSAGAAPDGGNARLFTSANSEYFSASAGAIWNSGTATTIAFWASVTADATNKAVFGHNAPNGYSQFLFTTAEYPYTYFDGALSTFQISAASGWDSWVITSAGATVGPDITYKNGVQVGSSGNKGWEPGSAAFYLGQGYLGGNYYNGLLTSVGIWSKVLDASEIAAFHNSGTNLRYAEL